MIITSKVQRKYYNNGGKIKWLGSHYNHDTGNILVYLPDILKDSIRGNETIEHVFTQHVSHEVLHKVLYEHVGLDACAFFDNLCFFKTIKKDKGFSFKNWFGGMDARR